MWTVCAESRRIVATFPKYDKHKQRNNVNIYVGNLSYRLEVEELRAAFERFGAVDKATIINDRETGRSKGFGFVEMPNDDEGRQAIEELNGADLAGRALRVNEAHPRESRPPRPRY